MATAVGSGQALFGLTDTDDAIGEVDAGRPVAIVYPDRGEHELGTLFIPNVLAIPKGAPHPGEAEALGNSLLGPEAEGKLASGPSAQIPLNRKTQAPPRVETPKTVHAMPADFEAAARIWDRVAAYLARSSRGGERVTRPPGRPENNVFARRPDRRFYCRVSEDESYPQSRSTGYHGS